MSTNTYQGIDYGHGQANINSATGIRYGVITQNSVNPEAFNDVWQNARDLSFERATDEAKQEIRRCESIEALARVLGEMRGNHRHPDSITEALADCRLEWTDDETLTDAALKSVWDEFEQEFCDGYDDCGERDWLYERDGYKLANCLQCDVVVLKSPYFTYAQFCSPCVPGACNLDSPLVTPPDGVCGGDGFERDWQKLRDNRAYCLGHDFFEDGRAPYPVYSVATGELIAP
jgi:hypothetical protein